MGRYNGESFRMPTPSLTELLSKAGAAMGIVPEYWDISGKRHETPDELRQAILRSLGIACDTVEQLEAALSAREHAEAARLTEPVAVLSVNAPLEMEARTLAPVVSVVIRLEDGSKLAADLEAKDGAVTLPELPLGYHEAEFAAEGATSRTRIIVCPDRAWLPASLEAGKRQAGLAVSLFGLRGESSWGCGDFTLLETLVDWVAECGGSYVALNPLHAIHNRQPYNTSPYLPNSTYYRNVLYLDVDRVPDLAACAPAVALRRSPEMLAEIAACNASEFVEYERVARVKLRFLRLVWDDFERREITAGSARARAFESFCESEGALLDRYATYCALDEFLHAQNPEVWIWPDWPEPYRDPDSAEVSAFRQRHDSAVRFHKYLQWLLDEQAASAQALAKSRGMEIGLFHDLPLATDRCGSELWAHRRFFVNGCRVGSPPDDFAPKGQDWSFPPPDSAAHRADGYRLFAESIRKSARHGGALRIDHVMRLFRLYWIPDGYDATQGTYVRDHHEDLLRVLALESHRNRVLIVGEDLGTVEPYMREALDRFGILSYRLFYFEKDPDGSMVPFAKYPKRALVSSTTHDLPTLAGFWSGRDIETRRALGFFADDEMYRQAVWFRSQDKRRMFDALKAGGFLPSSYPESAVNGPELSGELHSAVTGFLVSTPSLLMTLNQEDLTKELDQQNMPGTTWQYPNWRRKTKFTVEELRTSPLARDFASMFRYWLRKSDRLPSP